MEKRFHSSSEVMINGEARSMESFTEEERDAIWDTFAERIGKCISEYVDQHPEQYTCIHDALLRIPESELLYEEKKKPTSGANI